MKRCRLCVIPDTRPDTAFVDGICSACIAYATRPSINWDARREALEALLAKHGGRCIVPSSGGKDSHYQVLKLLELGARPLVVTASTCHLTSIGRDNIENLKRFATTIEVSPNTTVRAKLNRLGLKMVGDISWPEHVSIFTTPFKVAIELGIPLIFYGENPQNQYGGPLSSQVAHQMTRRWVSEFGGFLGLRPQDLIGVEGLTEANMADYIIENADEQLEALGIEAHFLGQYLPWDSHANAAIAKANGMRTMNWPPSVANYWAHENLDNAQTGIHDHAMFRKYGYGRLAAQISVDIRAGKVTRDHALAVTRERDGLFPSTYAGVPVDHVLTRIGMTFVELPLDLARFTDWEIFDRQRYVDDGSIVFKAGQ